MIQYNLKTSGNKSNCAYISYALKSCWLFLLVLKGSIFNTGWNSEGRCDEIWQKSVVENSFFTSPKKQQTMQGSMAGMVGPEHQEDGVEQGRGREVAAHGQANSHTMEDYCTNCWPALPLSVSRDTNIFCESIAYLLLNV